MTALVLVVSTAAIAGAQTTITGRVTDAQGNAIHGANVVVPQL
jgi:protocatechuate 3,4-dioxygenase beta subunit